MADFRCEKCGKLLSVDGGAGTSFRCPQCRARLLVPAGLAALPRPKIAGLPAEAARDSIDEGGEFQKEDKLFGVLAYGMPWVLSVFMHAGVFMLAMFVVFVVAAAQPKPDQITNVGCDLVDQTNQSLMQVTGSGDPNIKAASPVKSNTKGFARREGALASPTGESGKIDLIGIGGGGLPGGGIPAEFGLKSGGSDSGPSIFRPVGESSEFVFVIDRSGSMINTFDFLRKEMLKSIGYLKESHRFHVIFYSNGLPVENPPKQLIRGDRQNKLEVANFLQGVTPEGQTDPVPALKRAFDVLDGGSKKSRLIYLLSDGLFPDNNAVLRLIAERNPRGADQVRICTYLYGDRNKEAEEVMQKIAAENKGRYSYVNPEGE